MPDVNDDGYSDVIISAHGADEAYVFYGAATFSSDVYTLNTLSGTLGFVVSVGNDGDETVVAGVGVREAGKVGHDKAKKEIVSASFTSTTMLRAAFCSVPLLVRGLAEGGKHIF